MSDVYRPSAAAAAGRADFATIAPWIAQGGRVLDLGCGDGSLLAYLARGFAHSLDRPPAR